jgi:hypothetical protein
MMRSLNFKKLSDEATLFSRDLYDAFPRRVRFDSKFFVALYESTWYELWYTRKNLKKTRDYLVQEINHLKKEYKKTGRTKLPAPRKYTLAEYVRLFINNSGELSPATVASDTSGSLSDVYESLKKLLSKNTAFPLESLEPMAECIVHFKRTDSTLKTVLDRFESAKKSGNIPDREQLRSELSGVLSSATEISHRER